MRRLPGAPRAHLQALTLTEGHTVMLVWPSVRLLVDLAQGRGAPVIERDLRATEQVGRTGPCGTTAKEVGVEQDRQPAQGVNSRTWCPCLTSRPRLPLRADRPSRASPTGWSFDHELVREHHQSGHGPSQPRNEPDNPNK